MQTAEAVHRRIREMLANCITLRNTSAHDAEWRTGIKGAILEGRITILQELLAWLEA